MTKRMSADQFQRLHGPAYRPGSELRGARNGSPIAKALIESVTGQKAHLVHSRNALACWIPIRPPSPNEYGHGQHWAARKRLKDRWREAVKWYGKQHGFRTSVQRRKVSLTIHEPNKRRDPDNVIAGAWKVILDALVGNDYLVNDSPKWVELGEARIVYEKGVEGVEILLEAA